jgi:hypothetical protein
MGLGMLVVVAVRVELWPLQMENDWATQIRTGYHLGKAENELEGKGWAGMVRSDYHQSGENEIVQGREVASKAEGRDGEPVEMPHQSPPSADALTLRRDAPVPCAP